MKKILELTVVVGVVLVYGFVIPIQIVGALS